MNDAVPETGRPWQLPDALTRQASAQVQAGCEEQLQLGLTR